MEEEEKKSTLKAFASRAKNSKILTRAYVLIGWIWENLSSIKDFYYLGNIAVQLKCQPKKIW